MLSAMKEGSAEPSDVIHVLVVMYRLDEPDAIHAMTWGLVNQDNGELYISFGVGFITCEQWFGVLNHPLLPPNWLGYEVLVVQSA